MSVSVRRASAGRARLNRSTSPVSNSSVPSWKRTASTAPSSTRAPASGRPSPPAATRIVRGRSLISCADRAGLALGDQMAVHEHQHLRRHPLDLVQHVRRDDHRAALVAEPVQHLDDLAPLRRVEAVQRLVEQQQVGIVGERLGELHALAHAVREAADLALGDVGEADRLERAGRPRIRVGDLVQPRAQLDDVVRGQERPRRALVGDDADPLVHVGVPARLDAEDAHGSRARRGEARAQLERRGLPRTVVAEQAGHARADRERDVGDGDGVAVPARDARELDGRDVRHDSSPRNRHTSTSAETAISASQDMTHAVFDGSPGSGVTG